MKSALEFAQVFIHKGPVDMRRGIMGLSEIVQTSAMGELSEKNLFVFAGKRRDSIKILYFDRSGFCLWQKRLDRERFPWPKKLTDEIATITPEQLKCTSSNLPTFSDRSARVKLDSHDTGGVFMDLEILKKRISTFRGEGGRVKNVSDEVLQPPSV